MIRWCGQMSKPFLIEQGVRQGGVLSTGLYKVYVDPCLDRVTNLMIGGIVGEIPCPIPTCADDMTELSDSKEELQTLVDEGDDRSTLERYLLQPVKSVVMPVPGRNRWTLETLCGPFTESLCQLFRRQCIWVSRDQLYPLRRRWKKTSRKLGKCCTV